MLRWRAPQPAAPWSGTRDASKVGNACPQKRGFSLEGGGNPGTLDEDCLNLHVSTPRAEPGARLPVMVWLHGGALIFGAGWLPLYDGAALIKKLGVGGVLVRSLYRDVKGDAELGRQVVRDAVFIAFARRIAVLHATKGPVWHHYFSRVPDGLRDKQPDVPHGGEVPPVFGIADLCACTGATPTDGDRAAEQAVAARWVGLASVGRPDVRGLPAWPADAKFKSVLLELGDKQVVRSDFMYHRLNTFIAAGNLLER